MKRYILLTLLTALVGCVSAAEAAVSVFVSIPPQRWLVERVGGDLVDIHLLVQEGRNPHTFEPSPKEVAALSRGRVWFIMGLEFEGQLLKKIRGVAPRLQIVDITTGLQKLPFAYEEEHHSDGEHHHDEVDPHVWLAPRNMQKMATAIGGVLMAIDPDHASIYQQKTADVERELQSLDEEIAAMLAPEKGATFYVYHPSFGYFADAYGLHQEPVELGGKSPSPRQLAKLIARAKQEQVRVIFVQPQFDTKSGEAIAAAINGRVVPLNALAEDVGANLRTMARQIKQAMEH